MIGTAGISKVPDHSLLMLCSDSVSILSRAVMKAPKSCHITPILRSLHWLTVTEKQLIAPSVMLHLVSGISSFCLFVNLILAPVPPSPTHLFLHPSLLSLLIYHFVHL